jgi:hypothetical protein
MGTPQYMAPEQREHPSEVDHRADIYSLGVVFYQMLTGELPGKPIEMPSRKVQVDVRLDEVVLQALEKEPARRYQQASEVKTAVETIAATPAGGSGMEEAPSERPRAGGQGAEGGQSERMTFSGPIKRTMRKTLGIVVAIAAVLLALLLLLGLPRVSRVEDLTASGAGLELGEWQVNVGIHLTAVLVFAILAAILLRLHLSTGLTMVSWLTLGLVAAVVWFIRSAKSRVGVINEHGHGLTYDAWQASVIPWTFALVLVGFCAVASLVHWLVEQRRRRGNGVSPHELPDDGPALPPGNVGGKGEGRQR